MTLNETAKIRDEVTVQMTRGREVDDRTEISGEIIVEKFDKDGHLVARCVTTNLVTQVGDQVYGERGAGVSGAPAAPTGMKLGTGSTAVAKTGAGAALVTYLSGSNKAFDATYPQSALNGAARRITFKRTYAAGEATTASPITEVVIVNDTIATDATSVAANTISRGLLAGIGSKGATDTLAITWTHDHQGT
jgi:hypothetical protein